MGNRGKLRETEGSRGNAGGTPGERRGNAGGSRGKPGEAGGGVVDEAPPPPLNWINLS